MNKIIRQVNRAVVISSNDGARFSARLYVNVAEGIANASATLVARKFSTLAGAEKFAAKVLAA